MRQYSPSVVYHAAAYKHVPMMEAHVFEAIENNVFGTYNVAVASADHAHLAAALFVKRVYAI
ncbi:MAG: polysaccharide biosynthesis protein [Chthoniobacterales bacterium]